MRAKELDVSRLNEVAYIFVIILLFVVRDWHKTILTQILSVFILSLVLFFLLTAGVIDDGTLELSFYAKHCLFYLQNHIILNKK